MASIFEELSRRYPKAIFLKVDVDKFQSTAKTRYVSDIPTFILYRDNKPVDFITGTNQRDLESKIKHHYTIVDRPDKPIIIAILSDAHFTEEMSKYPSKLVVVDYTATWCGPCKFMAPIFEELASEFPMAIFFKVDVDVCKGTWNSQGVTGMPTFMLYRDNSIVDSVVGAKQSELKSKIGEHYIVADVESAPSGFGNLAPFIHKNQCECLNQSPNHSLLPFLDDASQYLESQSDAQLLISIPFTQPVKIHSLKIEAPTDNGPKKVKLFINRSTIDFDFVTKTTATEELELKAEDLEKGNIVKLQWHGRFRNVQSLQIFVENNYTGEDQAPTRINDLTIIGKRA